MKMSRRVFTQIAFIPAMFYSFSSPFSSFCQEAKKKYDKETEKYCGILEKHLNLSSKKKESQLQEVRNFPSILNKVFNCYPLLWICADYSLTENSGFGRDLRIQELDRCLMPGLPLSSHPQHILCACLVWQSEERGAGQVHPFPCWAVLITRMCVLLSNPDLFSCFSHP